MLLAHEIELRPTPEQREYLDKACGYVIQAVVTLSRKQTRR